MCDIASNLENRFLCNLVEISEIMRWRNNDYSIKRYRFFKIQFDNWFVASTHLVALLILLVLLFGGGGGGGVTVSARETFKGQQASSVIHDQLTTTERGVTCKSRFDRASTSPICFSAALYCNGFAKVGRWNRRCSIDLGGGPWHSRQALSVSTIRAAGHRVRPLFSSFVPREYACVFSLKSGWLWRLKLMFKELRSFDSSNASKYNERGEEKI